MLLPAAVLTGCDKDEPGVTVPDEPNNGSNDKDDDDKEKPGEEKPDVPDESGEKKVTINADGTTSDGSHFRRINETTFMLNYVKYSICDGHIEVTGHDNTEIGLSLNGKVDLYSTIVINNVSYKVRVIGARAFSDCNSLIEISIPVSVSSIKESAFSGCINLTAVTIPDSVVDIGSYAFNECSSLEVINLPNSITEIGYFAFYDCFSLFKVNLPNSLSEIKPDTFNKCRSLSEINIPSSISRIGKFAFKDCSLVHVEIPEGVRDISGAFLDCVWLKSISVPSTLERFSSIIDYDERNLYYCMEYIYFKSSTPPLFNIDYVNNNGRYPDLRTILVPEKSLKKYKSSDWADLDCEIIGVNPETFDFVQYLKDKGVYDF